MQGFQGYGSDYIKKVGYSPDAYVQMAIQLAIYRLFGKQAGTYEATQMRPYLHGRTETTRTVSPASAAFVKSMGLRPQNDINDESKRNEKLSLLRDAVQSHVEYIKKAGKGKGVDRHFFGMSMLLTDKDTPPTLFSDPLFIRSKRWRVSTSHLTHPRFENWGFGEVGKCKSVRSYQQKPCQQRLILLFLFLYLHLFLFLFQCQMVLVLGMLSKKIVAFLTSLRGRSMPGLSV